MRKAAWTLVVLGAVPAWAEPADNLVRNGSFETDADGDGVPDGWQTAGARQIRQTLDTDAGRDGRRAARLTCTHFEGATPASHVMICQIGVVGLERGRLYRVRFWARGHSPATRTAGVALRNTRTWESVGFDESFPLRETWQSFEFTFEATAALAPRESRLQFWFTGTGTLWLDEVEIVPVAGGRRWQPTLSVAGLANAVPNSSFECGTAGWGSLSPRTASWGANLYRLVGELDPSTAAHGRTSLKVHLASDRLPRLYFDYFEPSAQAVDLVLAAHHGWLAVTAGRPYVLSAFLRADAPGTIGRLGIMTPAHGQQLEPVTVGPTWQRVHLAVRPWSEFVHVAVGLDLVATGRPEATLWIDAVQFQEGRTPGPYRPRRPIEAFLETDRVGHLFTDPAQGLDVRLRAWNDTSEARQLQGTLVVTDFFDRPVHETPVSLEVKDAASLNLRGLVRSRQGFFRVEWRLADERQSIRTAVIEPVLAPDSRLGMNHAYGEAFLLDLSHQAGLRWWRDWSCAWHTVEPTRGAFDFSRPDAQVDRVLRAGGQVLLLLPFPSAHWSSSASAQQVEAQARGNPYLRRRLPVACSARDPADFERYVRQTVRHFRERLRYYHILNEPIYTTYALPRQFGYGMSDYLALLRRAWQVIKAEQPGARVVAGIGCSPRMGLTQEFIQRGGLEWTDVLDIHVYDSSYGFEELETALRALVAVMEASGAVRPIWITEFGCYADDEPACVPMRVGDATMQRCARPSERQAAADMVKLLTLFAGHGVEKGFFHAGTCAAINRPDAGGVFFAYGGVPRKMLAAAAPFCRFLPPGATRVARDTLGPNVRSYTFRTPAGRLTVAWSANDRPWALPLPEGVEAFDLMGNRLAERPLNVGDTPVYLMER